MRRERVEEQLRQDREAFEQAKAQSAAWFALRLRMGYLGIALVLLVAAVSIFVLLHPERYGAVAIGAAGSALLVHAVGLAIVIFRLVLQQGTLPLSTRPPLPSLQARDVHR